MRVTVRCPADGVVEVSLRDLEVVVVRSGSDVQATYRCPLCGSPVVVGSDLEPGFIAWVARQSSCRCTMPDLCDAEGDGLLPKVVVSQDAYVEYFRRELAGAETVEAMLAMMDLGERRSHVRSRTRRG
jgi:hypothetical protein